MKVILRCWAVVSLLVTIALVSWVNHAYGWRGLLAFLLFSIFVHIVFRKKTGRWLGVDGN